MSAVRRLWRWLLEPSPAYAPQDGRTLPWRFLRRQVRPYALAVSLATAVVFCSMLTESGVGEVLDSWPGKAIGVAAGVTTVLLWVGWWTQRRWPMVEGLLLSSAVWASVSVVVLTEGASWPSGLLAAAWMIASSGAWLLEVNDLRGRGEQ